MECTSYLGPKLKYSMADVIQSFIYKLTRLPSLKLFLAISFWLQWMVNCINTL